MTAYYNEIDRFKAAWLRELMKAGVIAPGEVDERSIKDVQPADLKGFTQCHFFAGIGVWSYALRQAGWPDDRPVWTGSCPCPSFSAAGKGAGFADPRHLWPAWHRLICKCRPAIVFGEQVDAAIGHGWLDLVQSDLEAEGYAVGKAVLGACSVGAPHRRQRLYVVADLSLGGFDQQYPPERRARKRSGWIDAPDGSQNDHMADAAEARRTRAREYGSRQPLLPARFEQQRQAGELGQPSGDGRGERRAESTGQQGRFDASKPSGDGESGDAEVNQGGAFYRQSRTSRGQQIETGRSSLSCPNPESRVPSPGSTGGFWRDAKWLWCRDGKYRAVEPGTFPLAHGAPARVGRLRGYGDAIVAPVAQAFIEAYLEFVESEK
jgi:DNA (cytosine-5)-methyltransferase 1